MSAVTSCRAGAAPMLRSSCTTGRGSSTTAQPHLVPLQHLALQHAAEGPGRAVLLPAAAATASAAASAAAAPLPVLSGRWGGALPPQPSQKQQQQQQQRHQDCQQQQPPRQEQLDGPPAHRLAYAFAAAATAASATASSSAPLGVQQLNEPSPPPLQQPPGGEDGQPPPPPGDPRDRDFFANVGDAIRTLRTDYPLLFVKDLNYDIYREDIEFKDPSLTFRGQRNYRIIFWSLRFHARLLLKAAHLQVLRIWQPEDTVIKVRWQINAQPRLALDGSRSSGTFDGISVYRLDSRGKVYQHEVTDVQMRDPPITNPLLYALNFILSPTPRTQQVPCPGSWFVDGDETEAAVAAALRCEALAQSAAAAAAAGSSRLSSSASLLLLPAGSLDAA